MVSPAVKLHQIRCVVAAARRGSFRQAAVALNLQQSSVSRCVRDLEDHLGVSIFERRVSGVRLTTAGDEFLRDAEQALEHLDRATGIAETAGRDNRHTLRIGAVPLPGSGILPKLLEATALSDRRVRLFVHEAPSREVLHSLQAGQIDLAIILGAPPQPRFEVAPLWTEHLFLASRRAQDSRPVAWMDIPPSALVLPCGELGQLIAGRLAGGRAAPWPGRTCEAGAETALRLVALDQGVAVVTSGAVPLAPAGVTCRPIVDEGLLVSAVRLRRSEKPVLRRFLALARTLVDSAPPAGGSAAPVDEGRATFEVQPSPLRQAKGRGR
jgi:DNA-binding transcriptional LysR family regulator